MTVDKEVAGGAKVSALVKCRAKKEKQLFTLCHGRMCRDQRLEKEEGVKN